MKIKTDEEIKGLARQYNHKHRLIDIDGKLFDTSPLPESSFYDGYGQAQSDLLESAGDGFKEYVAQNNGLYFGDDHRKEMDLRVWQACSLYHSRLIKEKDKIIENKSEYIFMLRKEIKEKDERIKELERRDGLNGIVCECTTNCDCISQLQSKYQEAVKEIESLKTKCESLKYFWKTVMDKFSKKYPDAGSANTAALTALTEAFDIYCENERLQKEVNELKDSVANLEFLLEGRQKDYEEAVKVIDMITREVLSKSPFLYLQTLFSRIRLKYGLDKQESKK